MKKKLLDVIALFIAITGVTHAVAQNDVSSILTTDKGYQKISTMPEVVDDYYYVIIEHTQQLMISLENSSYQGDANKTWKYRSPVDPLTDFSKIWMIETNNGVNNASGYAFRNVSEKDYVMQTEWNSGYNFRTNDQSSPCEWSQFLFNYTNDGYWTFENGKYPMSSSAAYKGYIGIWEEKEGIIEGAEVAANKSGNYIGQYDLYAINKSAFWKAYLEKNENTFDANILIINPNFTVKNGIGTWSSTTKAQNNGRALKTFGIFNNEYIYENWNGNPFSGTMSQTIKGLPNGKYELKAGAFREGGNEDVRLFANSDETPITTTSSNASYFTVTTSVTNHNLTIGLKSVNNGCNWMGLGKVSLRYLGPDLSSLITEFENLKKSLEELAGTTSGIDHIINNTLNQYPTTPSEQTDLEKAITALTATKNTAEKLLEEYNQYKSLYSIFEAFYTNSKDASPSDACMTYKNVLSTAQMNADAVNTVGGYDIIIEDLKTGRLEYSKQAKPNEGTTLDYTFNIFNNSFESNFNNWTNNSMSTQGNNSFGLKEGTIYIEKWVSQDNTPISACSIEQNINIPCGKYRLTVSAQNINQGDVNTPQTGVHIFAGSNSTEVTAANEYIVEFTHINGELSIGFKAENATGNWLACDNFRLELLGDADPNLILTYWKTELENTITEAKSLNNGANVGNAAFQIPVSAQNELTESIDNAQINIDSNDIEVIKTTINNLNAAIEIYKNATLNEPSADQKFNIILSTVGNQEWQYNGKALTFVYKGQTPEQNDYAINYAYPANCNFAQAFTIEKVADKNNYIIYFEDNSGNQRYICNGTVTGAGTGAYGIRTTLNKEQALAFEFIATTVNGNYNLKNTSVNEYMGSQDTGFYTVNSHINFNIQEAQKAKITLPHTGANWGTIMLPFNAEVPSGMTAYIANEIQNNEIQISETEVLEANKPYIVRITEKDKTFSFTDYGLATQESYTNQLLTGTYISTKAPAGSYVLQNQPEADGVAFYRVEESKEPTINSYRAYLTVPAEAGINSLVLQLPDDNVTGIETAMEADNEVDVYSISGVLIRSKVKKSEALNGLDKGIYIVNGIKQAVK